MPVTRFVADQLYEERAEHAALLCGGVRGACAGLCGVRGVFLLASSATFCQGLLCLWLFAELVVCWTAMSYLTALKEYRGILIAFAAAVGAAFGAGWVLVFWLGVPVVEGFLAATALGYGVMLGLDVRLLCRFFPAGEGSPWRFLRWVKRYRTLALTGLLLDLGLFAHLVIVWLGPLGVQVKGAVLWCRLLRCARSAGLPEHPHHDGELRRLGGGAVLPALPRLLQPVQ